MAEPQTPSDMAELLRQIRDAVQTQQRKHGLEIATAILLSLATVGSAWCAYQSSRWEACRRSTWPPPAKPVVPPRRP